MNVACMLCKFKSVISRCFRYVNFSCYQLPCITLILLMIGVFLIGQYQFAERILNGNHLEAMLDHSSRHRRDVLRKNDSVRGKARSPKLVFPSEYHVTGVLKLPYGSIEEPFESWYSGEQKMSRIDYYGGQYCRKRPYKISHKM